jgi:hypothetical protein
VIQRAYLVDRCPHCLGWMPRAKQPQHAVLQFLLEDIAAAQDWPPGSNSYLGPSRWWELFIAAFDRAQDRPALLLPAIDGVGFNGGGFDFVRGPRRRRNLNAQEIGEITEYVMCWASERGIERREKAAA